MSVCCDIYFLDLLSLLFYLFNGVAGYVQVKCKNVEGILRGRLETLQKSQMSQGVLLHALSTIGLSSHGILVAIASL